MWYPSLAVGYDGTYTDADGVITFTMSTSWFATGLLRDRTLTVHYNLAAQVDGFEEVYTLRD